MSRLRSFTGLNWVGGEIGEVIRKARDALEEYVEGGGEPSVLGPCVDHLSQVRGVLEMLQLRGAARLAVEMHASAQALLESRVASVSEVAEALMLSLIQLPDYLEKLEAGGEDLPLILLPAVNDLRASRGAPSLSDADLLVSSEGRPTSEVEGEASAWHLLRAARAARPLLHKGLLEWFRGADPEIGLQSLRDVFADLERNADSEPLLRGVFRAAHGVIEGLLDESIVTDNEVKGLVGRVDRVIKQIGVNGVAAADDSNLQRVFRDLLYRVSRAGSDHPLIRSIKTEYDLEHAFPSQEELAEARQRMFAPSEDTLTGIRAAAVKELMPIKDTLDLYIRGGRQHVDRLHGLEAPMRRLANTLDMAGLSNLGSRLRDGAASVKAISSGSAAEEDVSLMRVAGELLFVESSLDNVLRKSYATEGGEAPQETEGTQVPAGEMRTLIGRALQEAAVDMAKAKEAIVDYISSPSNVRPLETTPKLFHGIAGALRVISRPEAADVLDRIRDVIQGGLLKSSVLPDQAVLDALADSITCIEYYMEAVAEERADAADILLIAESAYRRLANQLAAEPIAESVSEASTIERESEDAPGIEMGIEQVADIETDVEEIVDIDLELATAESENRAVESQPAVQPEPETEGIDPEILEIFIEEAREEEPVIQQTYTRWREDPTDTEALATLRRSFHTLKGSGRLVGAVVIGEFAWSVENLLNRIIDQTLSVSSDVTSFLDQAVEVVPELVTAQEVNRAPDVDTDALMSQAKVLADKRPAGDEDVSVAPEDEVIETLESELLVEQSEPEHPGDELLTVEDSELREIFETEAREHLDFLDGFISDCARQTSPCEFDDELIRSLHTLAGSARMTGLEPIAVVAKALELKAVALSDKHLGADRVFIDLLRDGSTAMAVMVAGLSEPQGVGASVDPDELVTRVEAYEPGAEPAEGTLPQEGFGFLEDSVAAEIGSADIAAEVSSISEPEDVTEDSVLESPEESFIALDIIDDEVSEHDLVAPPVKDEGQEIEQVEPEIAEDAEPVEEVVLDFSEQDLAAVADEAMEDKPVEEWEEAMADAESDEQQSQLQALVDSISAESEEKIAPDLREHHERSDETVHQDANVEDEPVPAIAASETGHVVDDGVDENSLAEVVSADPELVAIFLEEALDLVEALDNGLRDWHSAPANLEIPNQLQRTLHTLKGGARLVGIQSIGNLSHAVETLLKNAHAQGRDGAAQSTQVLAQRAVDVLSEQVDAVRDGRPIRSEDELIEVLQAASLTAPEEEKAQTALVQESEKVDPEETVTGDRELVEIFLEEAHDLLDQLANRLREWVRNPDDTKAPEQLRRYLHTLKGGARLAGIQSIGDLSHVLETLLDGITPEAVRTHRPLLPLAQRAVDTLTDQVEAVKERGAVRHARTIIQELEFVHGQLKSDTAPVPSAAGVAGTPAPETKTAPKIGEAPPEPVAAPVKSQSAHEQVRVRSDLLNRLVNNSGEISIYHSRLEQRNNALGFNLNELEQTVTRLHDQLRQMEIETEAQILYRYERERDEAIELEQEFDPLELDRFSTIQQLSRSLMETVNDLVSIKNLLEEQQKESETLLLQHSRISNDLQDGLLRTRMVPFSQLVPRLHRVVRQTANSLNKRADLQVFGGEGEMDRSILDRMLAPMEHILRNAVSHGIEKPNTRRDAGKDETGKISIYLAREGNDVVITVSDDGAGLNLKAIRKRAVETGLLESGARIDDDDLMQLVLEPGFSTVKEVTQISGRGVGTDVLVSEVKQLGGSLEIASQPGRGTSFSIRLPFTLAISEALLVELGDDVFAVPHPTIEGVVRIGAEEIARCYDGRQDGFNYAGHDYQVRYLGALLGTATVSIAEGRKWLPLMLVRSGEHRVAIQVDRILGNRQTVVKSVGPQLSTVRWISGGTILADGRVALILDVLALVRMDVVQTIQLAGAPKEGAVERLTKVMVVDDSITVRKVTTRLLKRHNMAVMTAKDGVDAVAQLQEDHPDIMLLDIEMPRMDGYELARHMRNSPELSDIPIIMITSRSGEKHREYALSLGVKRYLGKPFQEATLMDTMFSVLAEAEAEAGVSA